MLNCLLHVKVSEWVSVYVWVWVCVAGTEWNKHDGAKGKRDKCYKHSYSFNQTYTQLHTLILINFHSGLNEYSFHAMNVVDDDGGGGVYDIMSLLFFFLLGLVLCVFCWDVALRAEVACHSLETFVGSCVELVVLCVSCVEYKKTDTEYGYKTYKKNKKTKCINTKSNKECSFIYWIYNIRSIRYSF